MVARSRTGCLTCRQRKLKCDEQRPKCGQCQKANRDCVPSTGIVFRHQQNASMNSAAGAQEKTSLQGFYAYKNSFSKDSIWVRVPKKTIFIVNASPDADFDLAEARAFAGESGLSTPATTAPAPNGAWPYAPSEHEYNVAFTKPSAQDVLSAAASCDQDVTSRKTATSPYESSPGQAMRSMTAVTTPSSQHSESNMSPPSNSFFSQVIRYENQDGVLSPAKVAFASLQSEKSTSQDIAEVETDHEVTFLLRHFAEEPGQWMDLFDGQKYFANYVPVKAITNPILKNATCAYAAKQLSLVNGWKSTMGGSASTQAASELFPETTATEWAYKGTQYYDKAIELLMVAIRDGLVGGHRNSPSDNRQMFEDALSANAGSAGDKRKWRHDRSLSDSQTPAYEWKKRRKVSDGSALSDEMTAATAILCDYELQEGPDIEWQRHLDGTKSLLDIVEGSMMPLQAPLITPRPMISRARQATYWNFARQDFLSALINETQTRLDTEDLPMWRDAGLSIDEHGFIRASNVSANGLPEGPLVMKEDMISNALIWIMGKIVNYAVASDTGPSEGREAWEGINQAALHQKWSELKTHLGLWYSGLPDTFKPCARLHPSAMPQSIKAQYGPDGPVFTEIWYNIPMCASTMQSYHMARMLLLLNMPQQSTFGRTQFHTRLTSYRTISKDIESHAHAICGIASSRPEGSVRVHSVQPLYIAGQSLNSTRERRELLRLLREIERDTGWATEYRARKLAEIWEWPNAQGPAMGDS